MQIISYGKLVKARKVLMETENNSVTTWRDRRQPDDTKIRDVEACQSTSSVRRNPYISLWTDIY